MMNILHGVTALLFALLLELFAGNFYVVIPFSCCVLNRVTAKFPLPYVFLCGFFTGLLMDLIYWRIYPGSALATGFTLLAVRLISDRSKVRLPLFKSLIQGALTGLLAVCLMALFNGYADCRRFPRKYHLLTSFCGALVFQALITPRSGGGSDAPERSVPQRKKSPRQGTAPRQSRRGTPAAASTRSQKKK